jgi:hypothetical protein
LDTVRAIVCAGAEKYSLLTAAARHRTAPDLYKLPGEGVGEAESGVESGGERVREAVLVVLVVRVADGVGETVELAVPDGVSEADKVGEGVMDGVLERVRLPVRLGSVDSVELGVVVTFVVAVPVGVGVAERVGETEMVGEDVDEGELVLELEPLAEAVTEGDGVGVEEREPAVKDAEKIAAQSGSPAGTRHVAHKQKGPAAPFPLLMEKLKLSMPLLTNLCSTT